MVTPGQKGECVEYAIERHKVPAARACKLFQLIRSQLYYQKTMPQKDEKIKELIEQNLGKGHLGRRPVIERIRKKHPEIGSSKIRRVYTQAGFSLLKRKKKARVKIEANPICIPMKANMEWAIDFMSDSLLSHRPFRTLNVIDQYNRYCLGIDVAFNIPSRQLTRPGVGQDHRPLWQTHGHSHG